MAKAEPKTCPSMLRSIIGQIFDSNNGNFCFFVCFFGKAHSPCRKKKIFENLKRKKEETLDRFLT